MTYEDAIDATVTREEARREIRKHSADWQEFLKDLGDRPSYRGSDVLAWLGY